LLFEDAAYAREALKLNLYFSFAGNLTYKNARNLHETIPELPVDRILIESESPFMIPTGQKDKKRNKPKFLPETALCLAKMLDMEPEAMADQLWENANRFFGLPNE